jgi:anti-sigma regulatory factor (Ser/Thr protein kinase)
VLRLSVPVALAALAAAQDRVESYLAAAEVPVPVQLRTRLVIEELLANLVMHGRFAGEPPPARLAVAALPDGVELMVEDAAAPFDPRTSPAPPLSLPPEERPIGGLGLAMVRRSATVRFYGPAEDGWNRTILWFPAR